MESLEPRLPLAGPSDSADIWFHEVRGQHAAEPAQAEWIVRFTDQAIANVHTLRDVRSLLPADTGLEVARGLGAPGLVLLQTPETSAGIISEALAALPAVQYFEPNLVTEAQTDPNDPDFSLQYALHNTGQTGGTPDADIDAPEAWTETRGSQSIVVAVLDTGLDLDHEDFQGNIWTNTNEIAGDNIDNDENGFIDDVNGYDFVNGIFDPDEKKWKAAPPEDDNGHGTHVSGIIGAVGDNEKGGAGVAWSVQLMPLKFLGANNDGFVADAVRAINYLTMMSRDHGVNVRVANNSWVSKEGSSQALEQAVEDAAAEGVLFVAGAGNGNAFQRGSDNDVIDVFPSSLPGDHVISVAATDHNDKLISVYNYGATSVDLGAPGRNIYSTALDGGYETRSGTSMATAFVSGTAALVFDQLPDDATPAEVRAAILQNVDPLSALDAPQVASGGRLNADRAVRSDTYRPRVTLDTGPDDVILRATTPVEVTLNLADNIGLDTGEIDVDDLVVERADGRRLTVTDARNSLHPFFFTRTAIYEMLPADGQWDSDDNGLYEIKIADGEILDTATPPNSALPGTVDTFEVNVLPERHFRVTSLGDTVDANPGDGFSRDVNDESTLRSAIMESNGDPDANTVEVPAGTIRFNVLGFDEDLAATGDLDINHNLTIRGAGAGENVVATSLPAARVSLTSDTNLSVDPTGSPLSVSAGSDEILLNFPAFRLLANNGSLVDGDTFSVSDGNQTLSFEFDFNNIIRVENVWVPVLPLDNADTVAARIANAINANLPTISATTLGGGVVFLDGAETVDVEDAPSLVLQDSPEPILDGHTLSIANADGDTTTFEFNINFRGVADGHERIDFDADWTMQEIAAATAAAINAVDSTISGNTVIDADALDRAFDIQPNATVTLENLIIRGGILSGDGGGIRHRGSQLVLRDVRVEENSATRGGGIFSQGRLELHATTVTNNATPGNPGNDGGGLFASHASPGDQTRIIDSRFLENTGYTGGGAYFDASATDVSIQSSEFAFNTAESSGGGLRNLGQMLVETSSFHENKASGGGGIVNAGVADVRASAIYRHRFEGGSVAISNTGTLTLSGVTITENNALGNFGGVVSNHEGTLEVFDSTIAGNEAGFGAGILTSGQSSSPVKISNSIIAGNTVRIILFQTGPLIKISPDVFPSSGGSFQSLGHNIIGAPGNVTVFVDGLNGDMVGTNDVSFDPQLDLLQDNGGPTMTVLPLLGSPAIDNGLASGAGGVDQRGFARGQDGDHDGIFSDDIGAAELYFNQIEGVKFEDLNANGVRDPQERGLAGWTIFVDANSDGQRDAAELFAVTQPDDPATPVDESGQFQIVQITPGPHLVDEELRPGWAKILPGESLSIVSEIVAGGAPAGLGVGDLDGNGHDDLIVAPPPRTLVVAEPPDFPFPIDADETLTLAGITEPVADVNVQVDISVSPASDLVLKLRSPLGTEVTLASGVGGSGSHFAGTTFDDQATTSIASGSTPFTGRFQPTVPLSNFNGEDANGEWELLVHNASASEIGTLNSWSLSVATEVNLTATTWLNDGAGNFTQSSSLPVSSASGDIVAVDMDGDADVDLAIANQDSVGVAVYRNNGVGGFTLLANYPVGDGAFGLAAAHLNSDDDFDLIATDRLRDEITVLLNAGNGTFTSLPPIAASDEPVLVAADKFNAGDDVDLIIANSAAETISFLAGQGGGAFAAPVDLDIGGDPQAIAVGDIDGDADLDVAVATSGTRYERTTNSALAIEDNQTKTSQTLVRSAIGTLTDVTVAVDITHSWVGDLEVTLISPDLTRVQLFNRLGGNGNNLTATVFDDDAETAIGSGAAPFSGTFRPADPLSTLIGEDPFGLWTLEVIDHANGDQGTLNSWTLSFTSGNRITVLRNNGDGSFTTASQNVFAGDPNTVGIVDIDNDGDLDVAATSTQVQTGLVLLNDGTWTAPVTSSFSAGLFPTSLTASLDTNDNGRFEFAVADGGGRVYLLEQTEGVNGVLLRAGETQGGVDFGNLAVSGQVEGAKFNDLNGNGRQDEGELGLPGWRFFVDLATETRDFNGVYDLGEPISEETGEDGLFSIPDVPPGLTRVYEVPLDGWTQIAPTPASEVENYPFSDSGGDPDDHGFTSFGSRDLWHLSQHRGQESGHSADDAFYFGLESLKSFAADASGTLLSPTIDLTGKLGRIVLEMNALLDLHPVKDLARVSVLHNNTLTELGNSADGSLPLSDSFELLQLDLTQFADQQIQLQFRFDASANPIDAESLRADLVAGQEYFVRVNGFDDGTHPDYDLVVAADNGSDLAVDATISSVNNGIVGFVYSVTNLGNETVDLSGVTMRVMMSRDTTFGNADDIPAGDVALSGLLGPGETIQQGGDPLSTSPAVNVEIYRYFTIKVDAGDSIFEINEENNVDVELVGSPPPDNHEPNDSFAAATVLGGGPNQTISNQTIHTASDVDYFRVQAPNNGQFTISVYFAHSDGDLDLFVYNPTESSLPLKSSTSATDNESVDIENATAGQTYFVEVVGFAGAKLEDYDLVIGDVGIPPDRNESDDDFDSATQLGSLGYHQQSDLTLHVADNDDFFTFTPLTTGSFDIQARFSHAAGDVDIVLYDQTRSMIRASRSTTDDERIEEILNGGETYYPASGRFERRDQRQL